MKSLVLLAFALGACSTDTFVDGDGAVGDGGGDASNDTSGDASGCITTPTTCPAKADCNSFDNGQVLAPFADLSQNGGIISFESDTRVTCPQAISAFVPQATAVAEVRAAIGTTATITAIAATHARLELDAILPSSPTGGVTVLYQYAGNDPGQGIGLEWENGFWVVRNHVTNDAITLTPNPRAGVWGHLAFDVTYSSSGGSGRVELDYTDEKGNPQQPVMNKATLPNATTTITQLSASVGVIPFTATSGSMKAYFDDVVFSPF